MIEEQLKSKEYRLAPYRAGRTEGIVLAVINYLPFSRKLACFLPLKKSVLYGSKRLAQNTCLSFLYVYAFRENAISKNQGDGVNGA